MWLPQNNVKEVNLKLGGQLRRELIQIMNRTSIVQSCGPLMDSDWLSLGSLKHAPCRMTISPNKRYEIFQNIGVRFA